MKSFSFAVLLFAFIAVGCAHAPQVASSPASPAASSQPQPILVASTSDEIPPKPPEATVKSPETPAKPEKGTARTSQQDWTEEYTEEAKEEQAPAIADPIEPFNRAMFEFNDKLYFWLLKPVAQGYKAVVPEEARVSVKNFFSNLGFPIRFVSCLLQADVSCAATEVGRFTVNTVWGIGGLMDPAAEQGFESPETGCGPGTDTGSMGSGTGFLHCLAPLRTIQRAGFY